MNTMMRERKWLWIGGALTGAAGVVLARWVAPALAGGSATLALYGGITLVFAGISLLAFATRRKASETWIAVERDGRR